MVFLARQFAFNQPFSFFVNLFDQLSSFLTSISFTVGGYTISYFWFIIAGISISILINVFWKGARG